MQTPLPVEVRPLTERDLSGAGEVFRLAFGTYLGLPDPLLFGGDRNFIRNRFRMDPEGALGAYVGDELAGSNFVADWGSVAFFGPLTVRPDLWDRGIARRLLDATVALLDRRGVRHAGLFTFSQSVKHVSLYQKYGFWPRFLNVTFSWAPRTPQSDPPAERFAALSPDRRTEALRECASLTDRIYSGLDLGREIRHVAAAKLGETLLLRNSGGALRAFAVCHAGAGTEAGSGSCYVKAAAVLPGKDAGTGFEELLDACESFASGSGASRITAGVNTGRHDAHRRMIARGGRVEMQGIAMHRPNEPGTDRPDVYFLDD